MYDFPGGAVDKNPPTNAEDMGLIQVREDPTCLRATKPESHSYWGHKLQLLKWEHPRPYTPQPEKPPQWEAHGPQQIHS